MKWLKRILIVLGALIGLLVLFLAGRCNTVIGEDFQRQQMAYFENAELVVIDGAGHELFAENADQSLAAVRAYLDRSAASLR